jgi:hypothetical protein
MYLYRGCTAGSVYLGNGYHISHDDEYGLCVSFDDLEGLNRSVSETLGNFPISENNWKPKGKFCGRLVFEFKND